MTKVTTLNQFIIERQSEFPEATGGFSRLLHHIGIAAKKVNREVNKAGLVDILGRTGVENVQGEEQQKLDLYANETFLDELRASGECCGVASEENEEVVLFEEGLSQGARYVVCMDPLDGSSNIDVNVSVGTIFAIYRRLSPAGERVGRSDFLQPGRAQVAAGYVIYGSSTMLVYSSGSGVNGFTLDPSIGEFCLSHPDIRIPKRGRIYSINEGNYERFPVGVPVGEDAFTTLECCASARRAALVPGAGYHYVMAPGSLTRGKRTEANLAGYLREAETRMALLEEKFPALAPYGWETWVYRAVQGYGDLDLVERFDQHSREEWRALFLEKFRLYYPKYRQSAIPSRRGRAAAVNYALFALCPPLQRGLYRAWARRRRGG